MQSSRLITRANCGWETGCLACANQFINQDTGDLDVESPINLGAANVELPKDWDWSTHSIDDVRVVSFVEVAQNYTDQYGKRQIDIKSDLIIARVGEGRVTKFREEPVGTLPYCLDAACPTHAAYEADWETGTGEVDNSTRILTRTPARRGR